ncbi:MAG: hypothetical protein M0C28_48070 [Candidatus Moduliflexus flocculans]|nr:hypothetical protein [Candidatus Moduliflexus flocculans]
MPYTGKKRPGAPTLGVFVPCDPRIDEESRTRAFNIGQMTAALLAKRLRLPDGTRAQRLHLLQARRQREHGRRRRPGDDGGRRRRPRSSSPTPGSSRARRPWP